MNLPCLSFRHRHSASLPVFHSWLTSLGDDWIVFGGLMFYGWLNLGMEIDHLLALHFVTICFGL
jgi:hypothetical protein